MKLGKRLSKAFGDLWYRVKKKRAPTGCRRDLAGLYALGPGDLAIDCGANLGHVARRMAERGAQVHAFEPNPDAFAALLENTSGLAVTAHNAAVLDRPGRMRLHLHLNYRRNPARFSESSSLIAEKYNVDDTNAIEVEVIDLPAFILALDRPVKLLKIDIEGAEYQLLDGLIERGALDRVERVLVETHADKIPSLRPADEALRAKLAARGLAAKVDLGWL